MQIDFSTFKTLVTDALMDHYSPEKVKISFHEIVKNNDTKLHGITIEFPGMNTGASPILYVDKEYHRICEDKISFDDFINDLVNTREIHNTLSWGSTAGVITEWTSARQMLYPVLVSADHNEAYLEGLVSKDFLDLKIIYVLRGVMKMDDYSCIKITKNLFEEYGISLDTLHEQAMQNLRNDHYSFYRIEDMLMDATGISDDIKPVDHFEYGLYCLSNRKKMYGAAGILDIDNLARVADGKDMFVIPSSVHEMLILPVDVSTNVAELNQMIHQINRTTVQPDEVLSDHAYYFNAAEKRLQLAA